MTRSSTPFLALLAALAFAAPAATAHIPIPPGMGVDRMADPPPLGVPFVGPSSANLAWSSERVEAGNMYYSSLRLDASGNPAISYYHLQKGDLKFARAADDGAWTIETVDGAGNVGKFSSLALAADGTPMIAYQDATNTVLKLATKSGAAWTTIVVDPAVKRGEGVSLAVGPNGHPAIAYSGTTSGLYFARFDGASWRVATVDAVATAQPSLLLDAEGQPSIAYKDVTHANLRYAKLQAGAWAITTVDPKPGVGGYPQLRSTSAGSPVIAYGDWSGGFANWNAKLATWTSSGWTRQDFATDSLGVFMIALTLDATDCPTLVYTTATGGAMKAARSDCETTVTQTITKPLGTHWFPSAATDSLGYPVVSFWGDGVGLGFARVGLDPCRVVAATYLGPPACPPVHAHGAP